MTSVECVLLTGAELGESPVWSAENEVLYWVDIDGRAVHGYDPDSGTDQVWPLQVRPSAVARTADPRKLLLAAENELGHLDLATGSFTPWVTLEEPQPGVRLNDGRCDPVGRFWVGGMFVPTSARRFEAYLHRVEPDGSFNTMKSGVGCSNGSAFSPDGAVMYWADTLHETVWAYDYDVASGEPSNERVFLDFGPLPGRPDGACVDESGCYWIACVGGSAVLRVTPTGRIDRTIEVPVPRPTMPAFGGPGLETMFITSIKSGDLGSGELDLGGAIFAFDPGVRGLPEPLFGG